MTRLAYEAWPDYGDPRLPDRFWEKVFPEPNSGCWIWGAADDGHGYGAYRHDRKTRKAYAVAFEVLVAPVMPSLEIDHLCRVRSCVNPGHLEPVTKQENIRRGNARPKSADVDGAKTHCLRGHEFDEANTYIRPTGGRGCRICRRNAVKRSFYAKRERAA